METAVTADRIDRHVSKPDSDSPIPTEVGSVKEKIGRYTTNTLAERPKNVAEKGPKVTPPGSRTPQQTARHDGPGENNQIDRPSSPKPPIPRKPVILAASTNRAPPPESPPTNHPNSSAEELQKQPTFISELIRENGGARIPRPYHYSGSKESSSPHLSTDSHKRPPVSEESKPKLPPRPSATTTTSATTSSAEHSHSHSPSPQASVSSRRSSPFKIDRKPSLPPRPSNASTPRSMNPGIVLEDNESRTRLTTSPPSFNDSRTPPSLLDSPSIMSEFDQPYPIPDQQPPVKKGPVPPPPRRRGGFQPSRPTSQKPLDDTQQPPRSTITPSEKKRYESVWAANKGLLIPGPTEPFFDMYPPDASEMVLNLVVRDIWSRSRLPNEVLQQIWDLVDRQGVRVLSREEFVVGMWLIDLKLGGRELPGQVPRSVWDSVAGERSRGRGPEKVDLLTA